MLLRDLILIARVGQVHASLVQFFAGQSSLLKQFLPAVIHFLLRVELLLGGLCIELRLLNVRPQVGGSGGCILGLGLLVPALILLPSRGQISVSDHRARLSRAEGGPASDEKVLYV